MKNATLRKEPEEKKEPKERRDFIRIKEAAVRFGMSKQWFYTEIMKGNIPAYKLNRTVFVSESEINDRIRGNKIS